MKQKEFDLSEKEMICCENMNGMFVYPSKHVKEFIEIIGFIVLAENLTNEEKVDRIMKKAGEKLK